MAINDDIGISNQYENSTIDNGKINHWLSELKEKVKITSGTSCNFHQVSSNSSEKKHVNQKQEPPMMDSVDNTNDASATKNHRFVADIVPDSKIDLGPIVGYAQEPLLPLAEACAPLIDLVHNIMFYVQLALDETSNVPPDGLTIDESASIRLYTIEWEGPYRSLYSMLNSTLKKCARKDLQPYFKYLKLFLTATTKLPCVPPQAVWRGVTKNMSEKFPRGTFVTWWAFTSCTTALTVLENDLYLGKTGERTLFSIETINGRTVRDHSHFITEDEILLLPGTFMEVQSQFSPAPDLHIIHLKQIKPNEILLELPFEGALVYSPEQKKTPWYKKKRTICESSLLIICCLAGIIVGVVFGTRRPPSSLLCIPHRSVLKVDYLWSFDCGDLREDLKGWDNGTGINRVTYSSPDFSGQGKALTLDRKLNQYVILPYSLNLTVNTSFTMSVWLYLTGYNAQTILSDCNIFNEICITFTIKDILIRIQLLNWNNKSTIDYAYVTVRQHTCQSCWVHVSFSFDNEMKLVFFYFNGLLIDKKKLNLFNSTSTNRNESKLSYFGLNSVNGLEPFSGLIDQLSITYYVKNMSEILHEATLLCFYNFDTENINIDSGPNNILAASQSVYQLSSNNQSSLLLNSTDSYFQSSGFTLLKSNAYEYSLAFWLRLPMITSDKLNSAITILQLVSKVEGISSNSYICIATLHILVNNRTMGYFFPQLYASLKINDYSIENNTWTHIGISYSRPDTIFIYINGELYTYVEDSRFSSIIFGNPRLSLTIGGAYLNDSISIKPEHYESMKCFAQVPVYNYTQMYGEIDDLKFFARALTSSEFADIAKSKDNITDII